MQCFENRSEPAGSTGKKTRAGSAGSVVQPAKTGNRKKSGSLAGLVLKTLVRCCNFNAFPNTWVDLTYFSKTLMGRVEKFS